MSVEKVLNRPMFRQVALRKGYLKPIKASTGNFVMNPVPTSFQTPSRFNPPMNVPQPGFFRGTVMPAAGATGRFLKNQFGLRGIAGGGGTFMLSDDLLTKLGVGGPLKTGINLAAGAFGLTPVGRAIGYGYTGLKGLGLLLDKIRRDNTNPNLQYGDTLKQITGGVIGGEPLLTGDKVINPFRPVDPTKPRGRGALKKAIEERKKLAEAAVGEGSEVGIDTSKLNVAKAEGEQNVKGTDSINVANIKSAAVEKATGTPDITMRGDPEANLDMQMKPEVPKPEAPVKEPTEDKQTDTIGLADVSENSPFAQQIALARKIKAELSEGRDPGLARRTFLLNLAAGLMSGTTKRQGLAGAVDVFGQALGPAVNNAVTVRLKEDELDNKLMGRALEFSSDFLKAQNESYVLPETKEVGVIQYINKNGKIVNVAGRMLKDGTKQIQIPGAVNPNGTSVFQTASAGTTFIANKDKNKETLDAAADLGGKYAALNLINRSLGIIEKGDAKVGVVGAVGLYSGRIQDAIGDIINFRNETKEQGKASFNAEQTKAAARLVREGEFDNIQDAKNFLTKELGSFDKIYKNNLNSLKKNLEGGSKLDYERLAINETVLVYRLANSLKSKDRLTQKDIQMAKELVKVFPFFRGDESVTAALVAVGETILDDIKQQETVYLKAGGSSEYLLRERRQYNLISPEATFDDLNGLDTTFQERKKSLKDLSQEELLNKLRIS